MDGGDLSAARIAAQVFGGFPEALIGSVGLGIVALAFWLAYRAARLSQGHRIIGEIVGWKRVSDSESGDHFAPIVRFMPRGQSAPIEVQSQHDFRAERGAIGEAIEIRYDPAHPERAETATAGRQWFAVAMIAILGLGTFYTAWKIGGG